MAVLPSWMVTFGPCLSAGGPAALFWGWFIVSIFVLCIALSMSEVISAYPLAGGVYSWSLMLSSKKWGPFMAWINGYAYLTGLIAVVMTLAYTAADFIYAIANTLNEHQVDSQGASVGLYIGLIIACTAYNILGLRFSAYLNKFMVVWVMIGTLIVVIAVPAMAPTHNSPKWVFTEFINSTGYESNGLVFLIGLLASGWALVGYECGAQIVEGTRNAATTAPRGIVICVVGAVLQGFGLIISTLFSIQDIDELLASDMPVATFFLRATNSPAVTAFFLVILLVAQIGSLCNSILAAGNFMWSLSRDGVLPYSKFLYKISGDRSIPINCLLVQLVICILVILPSFGSVVYWQAIMSAAVISINVSYGLPLLCRLIWVRNDMPKGPFHLGKFGLPLNFISVVWASFFAVILCIPSASPVSPENMNWSSVMIGAVMCFSIFFWFVSGRHTFKGVIQTTD
ncbi:amino acid/polyamine transporter I [Parasitella parasitica]|nr:amino acid/polyamine transporter I [Parasitella parasitica]